MLKIQQSNPERKQPPGGITGKSYRGPPDLPPESCTDQVTESYDYSAEAASDFSIVRGVTTDFPETKNDLYGEEEEDENQRKITGRTLSISRSGRCKNKTKNQFRMKVEDIYSDSPDPTSQNTPEAVPSPAVSRKVTVIPGLKNPDEPRKNSENAGKSLGVVSDGTENATSKKTNSSGDNLKHSSPSQKEEELVSPTSPVCKKPASKTSMKFFSGRGKSTPSNKEEIKNKNEEAIGKGSPSIERVGIEKREDAGSKSSPAIKPKADENSKKRKGITKKNDRNSSLSQQFHLDNDGLCKLTLHNESALLANVESTDL